MSKKNKNKPEVRVLNLDELTYGELEAFEEIVGFVPSDASEFDAISHTKMTTVLAFISGRRVNPDLTVEEVRNSPIGTYLVEGVDDVNPDVDAVES